MSWWNEREPDPFSPDAWSLNYLPNRFELEYLRGAVASADGGAPRVFVRRPRLKVFQPLKNARHQTVAFLLSDEHHLGRRDDK